MTPPQTPRGRTKTSLSLAKPRFSRGSGGVREVSWAEVEGACRVLAARVRALGKRPDYILAVANGGLVPAAVLKHALRVGWVGAVQFEHYEDGGIRKTGGARQLGLLPSPIRNGYPRQILVVDDVAETGDTLRELEGELTGFCKEILWATLFLKRPTAAGLPEPFIFTERADPEKWLRFPWEAGP